MSWLGGVKLGPLMRVTENWGETCPKSGGLYFLIGITAEAGDSQPVVIDRICGQDATGILYIGEGASLQGRLGQLTRSLRKSEGGHEHRAAERYHRSARLKEKFPANKLAIAWYPLAPPAYESENDIVKAYVAEFGEPPPLNAQGG